LVANTSKNSDCRQKVWI